jgi:hypothetical protein
MFSDPADFAITQIPIPIFVVADCTTALAISSCSDEKQSPSCQSPRSRFYCKLPHIFAIAFFRDHRKVKSAVRGTVAARFWKSGIWIRIILDPDLF